MAEPKPAKGSVARVEVAHIWKHPLVIITTVAAAIPQRNARSERTERGIGAAHQYRIGHHGRPGIHHECRDGPACTRSAGQARGHPDRRRQTDPNHTQRRKCPIKRLILAALILAAPLGGCANSPFANTADTVAVGGSVTQANPEVMANAEKVLTAAHIAYNALSQSILLATQNGILHGANAA